MLLDSAALQRTLARMAHEIAEANPDAGSLVLVGIQRGGVPVALRLAAELAQVFGRTVPCGRIDVTFYRVTSYYRGSSEWNVPTYNGTL